MVKNDISRITVDIKNKTLRVQLKCCLLLVVTFDENEKREVFQYPDFWIMIEKLIKKHKLQKYAPTPSIEEQYTIFDVLENFFEVSYKE